MVKYISIFLLLTSNVYAEILSTDSFEVHIEDHCEEGEVSCDNVSLKLKNRTSGLSIILSGTTMHTRCADGVTPCRFLGYHSKDKGKSYFVYPEGRLQIINEEERIILDEKGEWH